VVITIRINIRKAGKLPAFLFVDMLFPSPEEEERGRGEV